MRDPQLDTVRISQVGWAACLARAAGDMAAVDVFVTELLDMSPDGDGLIAAGGLWAAIIARHIRGAAPGTLCASVSWPDDPAEIFAGAVCAFGNGDPAGAAAMLLHGDRQSTLAACMLLLYAAAVVWLRASDTGG